MRTLLVCLVCIICGLVGQQVHGHASDYDKPLVWISFDFVSDVPRTTIPVPVRCSATDRNKSCACTLDGTANLDNPSVFKMVQNSVGLEKHLQDDEYSLHCEHGSTLVTPNLQMMMDFTYGGKLVVDCRFGDGSTCKEMWKRERQAAGANTSAAKTTSIDDSLNLQGNERRLIAEALSKSNGDSAQAAKRLGISERSLLRKMKEYKLDSNGH